MESGWIDSAEECGLHHVAASEELKKETVYVSRKGEARCDYMCVHLMKRRTGETLQGGWCPGKEGQKEVWVEVSQS